MKNILVIGQNSYIAKSFINFLSQWPESYSVDSISVRDDSWKEVSFHKYDTIYLLAGYVHVKETRGNAHKYYELDRDLPVEIARKACSDGVNQFIFMSSMSIYGLEIGVITPDTVLSPKTHYGKAKLEAENILQAMENDAFKVCIVRAPMVYGKGCKGNFNGLVFFVKHFPVFPRVNNNRSLIFIDNLCSFIKKAVDENLTGIYFPQNREYMNTTRMAIWISESFKKKIFISSLFGLAVRIMQLFSSKARKGFGTLIYKDTEIFNFDYCCVDLEESIKRSI